MEADRLDQMELCVGGETASAHVAAVPRDFRGHEDDVQILSTHGPKVLGLPLGPAR